MCMWQSQAPAGAFRAGGAVPAYLSQQIANYSAGLQRLLGGSSSGGTFT